MTKERPYLERYDLRRRLGRGGMGEVWLAFDLDLETEVALKFLNNRFTGEEAEILKRETRQGRILTHRHILPVYDFHQGSGERSAISMEYAPGGSLGDLVSKERPVLEVREIATWILQACDALAYAHGAGIVHRDVKPGNFLLGAGNDLKLADFGLSAKLAWHLDFESRETIGNWGTLHYASPQLIWNPYESHYLNDIYAMGVTIFVLLTGSYPFQNPKQNRWKWDPVSPISMAKWRDHMNQGNEPIPVSWDYAVARCLAEDPTDRPASAKELAEMLELEWGQAHQFNTGLINPEPLQLKKVAETSPWDGNKIHQEAAKVPMVFVILFAAAVGLIAGILWGAFSIFEMN